jgi:AAA+ superfamily predicted ATPase
MAQKLSIRLGEHYKEGRLIEFNTQSLLSKWFGESGKLVEKTFEQVFKIAAEESIFVALLIDEVETIAGSREKSVTGNETSDALRATNQLLTALDRLRHRSNVIVFCTSKFTPKHTNIFMVHEKICCSFGSIFGACHYRLDTHGSLATILTPDLSI